MARTGSTASTEILKDRRVQIGIAIVLLLSIAAVLFLTLGGGGGGGTVADAPTTGLEDPAMGGYPGAMDGSYPGVAGGYPGTDPGATGGYPGFGTGGTAGAGTGTAASGTPAAGGKALPNSFTGAPPGLQRGAGAAAAASTGFDGGGGYPGGDGGLGGYPGGDGGFPESGGFGGGAAAAAPTTAANKPAGVRPGMRAVAARTDPFVSFFRRVVPQGPPAYAFAVPLRLASVPRPRVTPREAPEVTLGPLPPVQRRVAGILYNGAVSAILETGVPGERPAQVVQPGSLVSSGVAGLADFTVESIAPTRLTLRAEDGRRTEVPLTGLPPGAARVPGGGFPGGGDLGDGGAGYPGGGGGGYPGGGGFPGGGGGYPGGGGFPGGGIAPGL